MDHHEIGYKERLDDFVDIGYPPAAKKDDDHVRANAKEVLSLGLLMIYFFPLFKCSYHTNYSVEAFNLLFEYEYALTSRIKQQMM